MPKVVNGDRGPVEQPLVQEFQPNRGLTTTRRWECTNDADATTKAQTLIAFGWAVKVTYGPKPVVEGTASGDGSIDTPIPQATDSWELVIDDVSKDFLEADIAIVNDVGPNDSEKLHKYINGEATKKDFDLTDGVNSRNASEYLWLLWKSGFRSVEVFQPVFRINRTVDRGYNTFWEFSFVGKLLTTATVKTQSFAPGDFLVSLDQIAAYYGAAPVRAATTPQGLPLQLAYAWKKYAPTVTLSGYDKKTIQQQFKFGLWDKYVHGSADGPY